MKKRILVIENKEYEIKENIWEQHEQMHPIRSMEALTSNLKMVYGTNSFTSEDIEKVIEDEYEVQTGLSETIEKAREIYEKRER